MCSAMKNLEPPCDLQLTLETNNLPFSTLFQLAISVCCRNTNYCSMSPAWGKEIQGQTALRGRFEEAFAQAWQTHFVPRTEGSCPAAVNSDSPTCSNLLCVGQLLPNEGLRNGQVLFESPRQETAECEKGARGKDRCLQVSMLSWKIYLVLFFSL
jgi:hypothetical protein